MNAEVVKLREYDVYNDIMNFLNLVNFSSNTRTTYEKGIRDFFTIIKLKNIEHLTFNDLIIKKKDVENFRTILKEHGNSNNTINTKVAAVRRLYDELTANDYQLNVSFFKAVKKLEDDVESYGFFTEDEINKLLKLTAEEKHDALEKTLFLKFAIETCIRKKAITQLRWTDFIVTDNQDVKLKAVDKGNKDFKAIIAYGFYQDLLALNKGQEFVFNINICTIDKMIPRLIKKMNLDESRNLTFHSLRKMGVDYKFNANGQDIRVAQKAANHSPKSLNVTIGTYLTKDDYGVKGYISEQYEKKEYVFNSFNEQELKELINSLDENTKRLINNQALKMKNCTF